MFENIAVLIIVCIAFILIGKRVLGIFSSRDLQCGCGSNGECSGCLISDKDKGLRKS